MATKCRVYRYSPRDKEKQREATLEASNGRMDRRIEPNTKNFNCTIFHFARDAARERKHFVNEINERIMFRVRSLSTDRRTE